MKVKSEIEVAQSCPTLHNPRDYSLPGSSIRGIFQARVLEWVAIPFSTWWQDIYINISQVAPVVKNQAANAGDVRHRFDS